MNNVFDNIFNTNMINKELKNRMRTNISRSKKLTREEAYKTLAADYIRISKEL